MVTLDSSTVPFARVPLSLASLASQPTERLGSANASPSHTCAEATVTVVHTLQHPGSVGDLRIYMWRMLVSTWGRANDHRTERYATTCNRAAIEQASEFRRPECVVRAATAHRAYTGGTPALKTKIIGHF